MLLGFGSAILSLTIMYHGIPWHNFQSYFQLRVPMTHAECNPFPWEVGNVGHETRGRMCTFGPKGSKVVKLPKFHWATADCAKKNLYLLTSLRPRKLEGFPCLHRWRGTVHGSDLPTIFTLEKKWGSWPKSTAASMESANPTKIQPKRLATGAQSLQ